MLHDLWRIPLGIVEFAQSLVRAGEIVAAQRIDGILEGDESFELGDGRVGLIRVVKGLRPPRASRADSLFQRVPGVLPVGPSIPGCPYSLERMF